MSLPGFSFQGRPERPGHARNVPQGTDSEKQFGVIYSALQGTEYRNRDEKGAPHHARQERRGVPDNK